MEIAAWLDRMMPDIAPAPWPDACWPATVKTRSPEHHPPFYWLGRALDEADRDGAIDALATRLLAAHGPGTCDGESDERDQRAQDVLSAACALAWCNAHLGPAEPTEAAGGDRTLLHVESLDVYVAPRRLRPVRTMEQLLEQLREQASGAACDIPENAGGRILYVDIALNIRNWARDVGYEGTSTETVRAALRHVGDEHRLGTVLTRPFQWNAPLEAWY